MRIFRAHRTNRGLRANIREWNFRHHLVQGILHKLHVVFIAEPVKSDGMGDIVNPNWFDSAWHIGDASHGFSWLPRRRSRRDILHLARKPDGMGDITERRTPAPPAGTNC